MNEEEMEVMIRRVLIKMFMDNLDIKNILESKISKALYYIENDCVCANYRQKHRTELLKKLTGKNKNFEYRGA